MKINKSKWMAVALLVTFPALCAADDLKYVPTWKMVTVDSVEYGCFTLKQMRSVVTLDLDMQRATTEIKAQVSAILSLQQILGGTEQQLQLERQNVKELDVRLTEKSRVADDLAIALDNARDRDVLGGALPWVVIGVLAAFAGGLVVGVYVDR